MDLVRQIEQTLGRRKQRHLWRDEDLGTPCRFDLVTAVSSLRWRSAFTARRVSSLRRSGESVLSQRMLTLPPLFVTSVSTLSLVRQTLGFNICNVLRAVLARCPCVVCEFCSHRLWDRCNNADADRFSSMPVSFFVDDFLYNSHWYNFKQICREKKYTGFIHYSLWVCYFLYTAANHQLLCQSQKINIHHNFNSNIKCRFAVF